jgi:hypothetical protein
MGIAGHIRQAQRCLRSIADAGSDPHAGRSDAVNEPTAGPCLLFESGIRPGISTHLVEEWSLMYGVQSVLK